ncbi:MAG: hypothetical protein ACFFD1_10660 [Candidatus Thorarchaeota archaeon]
MTISYDAPFIPSKYISLALIPLFIFAIRRLGPNMVENIVD